MKNLLIIFIIVMLLFVFWHFQRTFKYKFGYQTQVQSEIQPLINRIDDLEKRIKKLEQH